MVQELNNNLILPTLETVKMLEETINKYGGEFNKHKSEKNFQER